MDKERDDNRNEREDQNATPIAEDEEDISVLVDKDPTDEHMLQMNLPVVQPASPCQQPAFPAPPCVPAIDTNPIDELQKTMKEMMGILRKQQEDLKQLEVNLASQRTPDQALESLHARIDGLESTLMSHVTEALTKCSISEAQPFKQALSLQQESQEKQQIDDMVDSVSQTVVETITNNMGTLIKEEIHKYVLPLVCTVIEPITNSLDTEVEQKLAALDQLVKDRVAKVIRSSKYQDHYNKILYLFMHYLEQGAPPVSSYMREHNVSPFLKKWVEAVADQVHNSLLPAVKTTFKDAMKDVLIPGLNEACQNLFQNLNGLFQSVTSVCIQHCKDHMEDIQTSRNSMFSRLQVSVDGFEQQASEARVNNINALTEFLQQHTQDRLASITWSVRILLFYHYITAKENMRKEMHKFITDVKSSLQDQRIDLTSEFIDELRSTAETLMHHRPGNGQATSDLQTRKKRILALLEDGKLNEAFHEALSAQDIRIVIFICQNVEPCQVFNQQPCPLTQPVLLSLIQQLSTELTSHTELRHKYIEKAVISLDTTDDITKEHAPSVLEQLHRQLMLYIQQHPQNEMSHFCSLLSTALLLISSMQ